MINYFLVTIALDSMPLIAILSATKKEGVVYYRLSVSLPLRSLQLEKRYSEFVVLVQNLCSELGISQGQFPYPLPPKGSLFTSESSLIEKRKTGLSTFLNRVIQDRDLQNRKCVHEFLQLPLNFKFTPGLFKNGSPQSSNSRFLINEESSAIDKSQWLVYLRNIRFSISRLPKESNIQSKLSNREIVGQYIKPNIEKLADSLIHLFDVGLLDRDEFERRTVLIKEALSQAEEFLDFRNRSPEPVTSNEPRGPRGFGSINKSSAPLGAVEETPETKDLNSAELLQQQQQIHKDQDQELMELRAIIARQRTIGEAINTEVEEQDEILNGLNDDVERSSKKLQDARQRARRVL